MLLTAGDGSNESPAYKDDSNARGTKGLMRVMLRSLGSFVIRLAGSLRRRGPCETGQRISISQ